jgi:hypothetical protein
MVPRIAIYGKNFSPFPERGISPIIGPGRHFRDPGGFMHSLKLLMEVWVVLGVVTVVAGLIWTTRLSREMNPEIKKVPPLPERQLATASLSKLHSA